MDIESTGGFAFMPVINAMTMEPFQFAFAQTKTGDPGAVSGNIYSPEWVSNAMLAYSGVFGSGASPFFVFMQYMAMDAEDELAAGRPPYFAAPPFETGKAPLWDPSNPPAVEEYVAPGEEYVAPQDEPVFDPTAPVVAPTSYVARRSAGSPLVVLDTPPIDFSVPEPSTVFSVATGVSALFLLARRRKRPI